MPEKLLGHEHCPGCKHNSSAKCFLHVIINSHFTFGMLPQSNQRTLIIFAILYNN